MVNFMFALMLEADVMTVTLFFFLRRKRWRYKKLKIEKQVLLSILHSQ
jgi:hypothetical protein